MKNLLLILSLLMCTGCTELQVGNTLYATAIGTTAIDWGQTRAIVRSPERWSESNPVLGPHPTYAQVDVYFPAILLGTAISYPFIKPSYRPYLYGALTLLESIVIIDNFHGGLRMDFVGVKF